MIFLEYLLLLNYPLHLCIIVFLSKIMIIYIFYLLFYLYIYIYIYVIFIYLRQSKFISQKIKLRLLRLWLNKI